jgi:hypothetical protein
VQGRHPKDLAGLIQGALQVLPGSIQGREQGGRSPFVGDLLEDPRFARGGHEILQQAHVPRRSHPLQQTLTSLVSRVLEGLQEVLEALAVALGQQRLARADAVAQHLGVANRTQVVGEPPQGVSQRGSPGRFETSRNVRNAERTSRPPA